MNILITCALGRYAKGVTTVLRNNPINEEVYLVGVDMVDNDRKQYYDKTYIVPAIEEDNYIDTILNICKEEKIDIYIPWSVLELDKLYNAKRRFSRIGTKLLMSSPIESVRTLTYKDGAYAYLKKSGLPTLIYSKVNSIEDIRRIISNGGNWVCKVTLGEGGRGTYKLTKDAPLDYIDFTFPSVVQEYVPNAGHQYIFDGLAKNGEIVDCCIRSSCYDNGQSYHEVIENEEYKELCSKILKDNNYTGLINIQAIKKGNTLYVIDINPRLWGPIEVTYQAGGNMLWEAIELLIDGKVTHKGEYEIGKKIDLVGRR